MLTVSCPEKGTLQRWSDTGFALDKGLAIKPQMKLIEKILLLNNNSLAFTHHMLEAKYDL